MLVCWVEENKVLQKNTIILRFHTTWYDPSSSGHFCWQLLEITQVIDRKFLLIIQMNYAEMFEKKVEQILISQVASYK